MLRPWLLAAISVGVVLGTAYTLSPLAAWCTIASAALVWAAGRNLPSQEQRWVRGLIGAAIAVRVLLVVALFLFGTSDHAPFNVFFGDEQYLLFRSWRLRNLWLGTPLTSEAFRDVYDFYGRTSYLNVIAYVQLLVGPAPYGIHLLNATLWMSAAVLLHRLARRSYGHVPALLAFGVLLFFPSLIMWSSSALKESLNFVAVMVVLASVTALARADLGRKAIAVLGIACGLGLLATLRAGIFEITVAGLAAALFLRVLTYRMWRAVVVALTVPLIVVVAMKQPRIQSRTLDVLRPAARMHLGHVLTRGHAYKVLDERFYQTHDIASMNWEEGKRFVARGLVAGILLPLPWNSQSSAELLYVPEQVLWYALFVAGVVGFVVGLRRDALVTCLLATHAATALAVVSINTGNIGTLVRHRSLALPYVIVLAAVGVVEIAGRLATRDVRAAEIALRQPSIGSAGI